MIGAMVGTGRALANCPILTIIGRIIALFVVFGILAVIFVSVQFWKQDTATVPPRVLKQRTVGSVAFFSMCLGGSFCE